MDPRWVMVYLDGEGFRPGVWSRTVERGKDKGKYELYVPVWDGPRRSRRVLVNPNNVNLDIEVNTKLPPWTLIPDSSAPTTVVETSSPSSRSPATIGSQFRGIISAQKRESTS